jgi:hypothetical protein
MSATEYRIFYSKCAEHYRIGPIYRDATYEFRNVTLPRKMLRWVQPDFKLDPDSHTHTLKLLSGKSSSMKRIEYQNAYASIVKFLLTITSNLYRNDG